MSALTPAERARLVGILGRLESDFAGERDAAALAAVRFLKQHRITWSDVMVAERNLTVPGGSGLPSDWRGDIERCIRKFDQLTAWEQDFLVGLRGFSRLSSKQAAALRTIAAKLQMAERAA